MDKDELLKMAMGVSPEGEEAIKQREIMDARAYWEDIPEGSKAKYTKRRKMRKAMFQISKCKVKGLKMTVEEKVLEEMISAQLDSNFGLTWPRFTFTWDLDPVVLGKVVLKEFWTREGGRFDDIGQYSPTAFTGQVID